MNNYAFSMQQPAENIVQVTEAMGCRNLHWYALLDGKDFSLVDAGLRGSVSRWLDSGRAPAGQLQQVIFTHADADHIGDGSALQERYPAARLLAHAADRAWIENHDRLVSERYDHARPDYGFGYDEFILEALREACGPDFSITSEISEGEAIHAGRREWEVLHVPGHSPGHICMWNSEDGILLAGDCILGEGPPDGHGRPSMPPTHQNIENYLTTISRLQTLPVQLALTGHWPPLDGTAFQEFLSTSERVVQRDLETVKSALSRGTRDFEQLLRLLNETHGCWQEAEYSHYSYALAGYLEYLKVEL